MSKVEKQVGRRLRPLAIGRPRKKAKNRWLSLDILVDILVIDIVDIDIVIL